MRSSGQEAWTFSELLEPLALIPQYIVCYRAGVDSLEFHLA